MISLNHSNSQGGAVACHEDAPADRSVSSLLRHARDHWRKSALFTVLVAGLTVGCLVWAPRTYSSQAKLFIRIGRESITLDPTATTGQTVSLYHDHEYEMNSVVELLQSRGLIEVVVDRIGPEKLLSRGTQPATAVSPDGAMAAFSRSVSRVVDATTGWIRRLDPIDNRERAIHLLQRSVGIRVPKRSQLVCIECRTDDPHKAKEIVTAILDLYQEQHLQVHRTAGAFKFFEAQAERTQRQLETAGDALSRAKNELGWLSAESQRDLIHSQLSGILARQQECQAALAAASHRVDSLASVLAGVNPRLDSEQVIGFDNTSADLMRRELYDLELSEAQLKSVYTDQDPRVRAAQAQLAEARALYDEQPASREHSTTTINATHQNLEQLLLTEKSQTASLQAELSSLQAQQSALAAEREQLNSDAIRLAALQREYETLESNYRADMQHLEQSRINEALEHELISNVNVAQAPTLVSRPVSPDKLIVCLAGILIAVGGSLLLPFCFAPSARQSSERQAAVASQRGLLTPLHDRVIADCTMAAETCSVTAP